MGNRSAADADGLLQGRGPGAGGGAGTPGAAAALAGGVLLIGAVLAGNALVCVSVAAERALQTPTNYFIVSLAAADLLLALLVLPLFVYSEVQGGVWLFSPGLCDALMAMDVMLCTASIFNLCAISVDRFVAVAVPLSYNRQGAGGRQLLLIGATWLLSAAVAAPVLCGLNDPRGRDPAVCRLENRDYVVYSSVCSFFLPCPLMLLLYWATFRGLRRWEAARQAKLHCRAPRRPSGPGPPPPEVGEPPEAVAPPDAVPAEPPRQAPRRRRAKITGRERKAMRVLPVVVGAFLVCWTPFFVVHITRALCPTCAVPPRLVSAVTWLGYVNSALNPVIYTVFNAEFRTVFRKALRLCCWADPSACAHCVLCEGLGPGGPGHASGGRTPVREGVLYD
ncbi:LOW QUALITY PROTEIN: D(4) dopamine receptor [Panthera uncia]|uniref:LOW QUALITY PROTEIN: D(4) dopamine receptor n=1 Tax=Panthera uncia TaxID=29064 RepID=UPI0020FF890D|nr:LOW QUALITY PROTEIN: D(4) dopamine receptor [Panthera uncia]